MPKATIFVYRLETIIKTTCELMQYSRWKVFEKACLLQNLTIICFGV